MDINYEDYKKTIQKHAWRCHNLTGIEVEELISAGNEEFVRIQNSFDGNKSCFGTYLVWKLRGLYSTIRRDMINSCMRPVERKEIKYIYKNIYNDSTNPEKNCIFGELIQNLPKNAKEIINMIFSSPDELIETIPKKRPQGITKAVMRKYLINQCWNTAKINKAFNDIQEIWT